MKIVVDSNRVIAALIKESTTREILFGKDFEFVAPDFIMNEVRKYQEEIITKSGVSEEEFDVLLSLIFENIEIISEEEYKEFLEKLKDEIKDEKDVPYIAVSVVSKADGIWTHDPHFKEQEKIKIFSNIDMLRISGKAKED
ncbi:MAG: PIN domain-containing protein [Candidatus Pacearchaeota archaeon]|nr:PIN domain-containing protein [Candidatus Pacearchaeota archaeon]